MSELGLRENPDEESGLNIVNFSNRFSDMGVDLRCASCSSAGLTLLPSILEVMKETEATDVLGSRMKYLVQDVVISDSFQTVLDRLIHDAPKMCPHRPEFTTDVDSIRENYEDLPVPSLSGISLDTAGFVIATSLQIGFVMFTSSYVRVEVDPEDTLLQQNAFVVPEDSNLVNFTEFNLDLPSWLRTAVDQARKMIGGTRIDPSTGQEDLAVNVFIRDMFGSNGTIDWSFEGVSFGPEDLQFEVHSLRIDGLDTFKTFDVLAPLADQTLLNDIEMEVLDVTIDFSLRSRDADQRIQVGFRFDGLNASIPLFAAIDKDLMKSLQVGSLLQLPNVVPCLLSAVYGFRFPNMLVNVGKIHLPTVTGLMPETDAALTAMVERLFELYGATMHEAIPSVFDNSIRPFLNSMFESFISGTSSGCSNPLLDALSSARKLMQAAGPPFLDFRDLLLPVVESLSLGGRGDSRYGDLLRSVWGLIEQEVLEVGDNGVTPINTDVIAPLTESISNSSGNIYFPGEIFDEDLNIVVGGLTAGVAFRISDVRIENIDTIGNPFSLLDPVLNSPSLLNNTATIGVGEPLRMGVRVFLNIASEGKS
jgi:hypothetical protein